MFENFKSNIPSFALTLMGTLSSIPQNFKLKHSLSNGSGINEPFFVVGCGRSGNTLLRKMLVSGGDVSIPPESYVLPRIVKYFLMYNYLPWNILSAGILNEFESYPEFHTWGIRLEPVLNKARALEKPERTLENLLQLVYREYLESQNHLASKWGDKTPINSLYINKIHKVFPGAKYVHMLRDPRATTASYLKAGLKDSVEEAVTFWVNSTNAIVSFKKRYPHLVTTIEYEDLVKNPEIQLNNVCRHLNVNFKESMLLYWKDDKSLGDTDKHPHHANTSKPISLKNLDKWKEQLKMQEIRHIENRCKHLYRFS